jgi:uncharacterized protein (DUF952 family)
MHVHAALRGLKSLLLEGVQASRLCSVLNACNTINTQPGRAHQAARQNARRLRQHTRGSTAGIHVSTGQVRTARQRHYNKKTNLVDAAHVAECCGEELQYQSQPANTLFSCLGWHSNTAQDTNTDLLVMLVIYK